MAWVVDSSTWISLARSGLLGLARRLPIELVLLDVIHREVVIEGRAAGHADAEVIAAVLESWPITGTPPGRATVDEAVLVAAGGAAGLVANDLALGRRAKALAIPWLRTADLVVLAVRSSVMDTAEGHQSIEALEAAGRISAELAGTYRRELG
jgi:hypothetical protein